MALPVDLSGTFTFTTATKARPMKVGSAFYIVGRAAVSGITVMKATDTTTTGGSGWTAQDTSNRPTTGGTASECAAYVNGTTIHIVYGSGAGGTSGYVYYNTFDTSTDTWSITDETIVSGIDAGGNGMNLGIGVRSDGDVVAAYQGVVENIMGTNYSRAYFAERISGTWTTDVRMDNQGKLASNFNCAGATLADQTNDRFPGGFYASAAADLFVSVFPGDYATNTWTNGSQDTTVDATINTATGPQSGASFWNAFTYSSTRRIKLAYADASGLWQEAFWDDAASPSITIQPIQTGGSGTVSYGAIANDSAGVQHALYVRSDDATIILHKETSAGANIWGSADNELDSASTVVMFSAAIYDSGSGDVLAYLYTDNAVEYYGERSLSTAVTGTASQASTSPTQAASGIMQPEGTASQQAPTASQVASGSHTENATGTASQLAPAPSQTATGAETISGAVSQTFFGLSQSASGGQAFTGAASQLAATPSQAAAGYMKPEGGASQLAPTPSQVAAGTHTVTVTGAVSQATPAPSQDAAGFEHPRGAASQAAPTASQVAAGTHSLATTGSATQTAPTASQALSGAETIPGAAAQTAATPSQVASGLQVFVGGIAQAVSGPSQVAAGVLTISGAANQSAPPPGQVAAGAHIEPVTGTASQASPAPTQTAAGVSAEAITGTASQLVTTPSQALAGVVTNPVIIIPHVYRVGLWRDFAAEGQWANINRAGTWAQHSRAGRYA